MTTKQAWMTDHGAKYVGYWEDLKGIPEEGPFVVCHGPVGAQVDRIEHVRGPDGVGCPVTMHLDIYKFMEEHGIPRGYKGACILNNFYREGAFRWDGRQLRLAEQKEDPHNV